MPKRRPPSVDQGRPAFPPYAGLLLATLAVSFAAIFIRFATTPPLVTATFRMAIAVALLSLPGWRRRRVLLGLSRHDALLMLAAGLLLALHFASWTVSLFYTSVASSVLFVSVHPVLVAAIAWLAFGERPRAIVVFGITLAVAGSAVIAGHDLHVGGRAGYGDALALFGALVFAFYLVIGRRVRQRLDPITYSAPVYAVCMVVLALIAAAGHQAFDPLGWRNMLLFLALAVVPTLGGHLVYNWTLRYVDAAIVSVSFLGEPVLSAALAWPLLGQPVALPTLAGGTIVLIGIYLTLRSPQAEPIPE